MLFNRETGVPVEVDPIKSRIRRMQKRVHAWSDALNGFITSSEYRVAMITLTYRASVSWEPNHIKDFRMALQKECGDGLVAYAWVAELQERGAVHYHFLAVVKRGTGIPKPDKSGMWPHGSSRIETARTVFYICTYVGKQHQKAGPFPKGLRMFHVEISKRLELAIYRRFIFRVSSLPSWLCTRICEHFNQTGQAIHARRVAGGGWQDDTGAFHYSPWVFIPDDLANDDLSYDDWLGELRERFPERKYEQARFFPSWVGRVLA